MDLDWILTEAKPSDSDAIASLFAQSWISPFTQLQFGLVDPRILAKAMAPRIARQMSNPNVRFVVVRHPVTHIIVSVAQWTLPQEDEVDTVKQETQEARDECQSFEDEAYMNTLPEGSNKDLILAFTIGLRNLRQQALRGRKHFLLENLATHSEQRGKGLASRLIETVFLQADENDVLVYLDTAIDNPAMRMYKKLGFKEKGRHTIEDLSRFVDREELERHGGILEHTHVAFIRYPMCKS
ncbi:Nn.00g045920.m01.CDS01 [Neocucurbitaria sp. VM-36]